MRKFVPIAVAIWAILLLTKITDFLIEGVSISLLPYLVCEALLFGTCTILVASLLWLMLHRISERWALHVSVFFLAFSILLECVLSVYSWHTGLLLGNDFFIRPTSEILSAIGGFMPLWGALLLLGGIGSVLFFLLYRASNSPMSKKWVLAGIAVMTLSFCSFPFIKMKLADGPIRERNCLTNKTLYLLLSKTAETRQIKLFEEKKINDFKTMFPHWDIQNPRYPLERLFDEKDILSSYFYEFYSLPNVVIILEESFGREWAGNLSGESFTPFFDSLARTGLYWENCISIAPRSFAAVPAILGSVPYGNNGFQFGAIPHTNGLIPILQKNDYVTEAFYGGDFVFDCMQEYLQNQHTDYISNYYSEFKKDNSKNKEGFMWGYHDSTMFSKSIRHIKGSKYCKPTFRLYVTLTAHDELMGINWTQNKKNKRYEQLAESIIRRLPENKSKINAKDLAPIVYADDCLRYFFNEYSKLKDFDNTIFILTGDHASGKNMENDLSFHHVPLVVWSPKLKQRHLFQGIISHNDIAPTILAFLNTFSNFHMTKTSHFIGQSFDTSSSLSLTYKIPLLNSAHEYDELIFDTFFFKKSTNKLYTMEKFPKLTSIENDSLLKEMKHVLATIEYVHKYSYQNNCITSHPLLQKENLTLIKDIRYDQKLVCRDSTTKIENFPIPKQIFISEIFPCTHQKKIKIVLQSDILLQESNEIGQTTIQMDLKDPSNTILYHYSGTFHNFLSKKQENDSTIQFYMEKHIDIHSYAKNLILEVSLSFPHNEQKYQSHFLFKNLQIYLYEANR